MSTLPKWELESPGRSWASGIPVIATPIVAAVEQLNGSLKSSVLTDPDNPQELAEMILWMLDPDPWPTLSGQARRTGENSTWEDHFHELKFNLMELDKLDKREDLT